MLITYSFLSRSHALSLWSALMLLEELLKDKSETAELFLLFVDVLSFFEAKRLQMIKVFFRIEKDESWKKEGIREKSTKTKIYNQGAIIIFYNQQIMSRQSWSIDQDSAIIKLVQECGVDDWTRIAWKLKDYLGMQKRTGKQCRERWYNHLSPSVNKQPWTQQEEELLFIHHKNYGNRWKDISKLFIGRTDNDIKNHFYSTLRRSLRRLNKIVGEKNSTTQMREIKPSVLSTIMNFIYQQDHPETQLVQSLKDLPILIFEFAKFKPIKINIKNANIQMIREKTNEIFTLISRFNQEYEMNKEQRRFMKSQRKHRRQESHKQPSQRAEPQVKIEQNGSYFEIYIKKQYISEEQKVKIQEEQHEQPQKEQKHSDKTQFSLHPEHYNQMHHQELTPIALLNHQIQSPKVIAKEGINSYPSNHRRFSLQADDVNQMHFNQPQEPSHIDIEQEQQFLLGNQSLPEHSGQNEHSQLIDDIIETNFKS